MAEQYREQVAKEVTPTFSVNHLNEDGGVSENDVYMTPEQIMLERDKGIIPKATSTELGITIYDVEEYRGTITQPVVHDVAYSPEQYRYDIQTGRDTVERQVEVTSFLESVNITEEDPEVLETEDAGNDVIVGGGGGAGRGGWETRSEDAPDKVITRTVDDIVEVIETIDVDKAVTEVKIAGGLILIGLVLIAVIAVST